MKVFLSLDSIRSENIEDEKQHLIKKSFRNECGRKTLKQKRYEPAAHGPSYFDVIL